MAIKLKTKQYDQLLDIIVRLASTDIYDGSLKSVILSRNIRELETILKYAAAEPKTIPLSFPVHKAFKLLEAGHLVHRNNMVPDAYLAMHEGRIYIYNLITMKCLRWDPSTTLTLGVKEYSLYIPKEGFGHEHKNFQELHPLKRRSNDNFTFPTT